MSHPVLRPSWLCGHCLQPWPCPIRQQVFLRDYRGRTALLRSLLWTFLIDASAEIGDQGIEQLHDRFLSWV